MDTGLLDKDRIVQQLACGRIGNHLEVFQELPGTNRYILDSAAKQNVDGWIVIAEHQTAGSGRLGRSWHCPTAAGILCTVAITDGNASIDASLLSLVVPIALVDALRNTTDVPCEIKWPNDIISRKRKLGGILIETTSTLAGSQTYAIGFGVNCLQHRRHFPQQLQEKATSLDMESKHPIRRTEVVVAMINELDKWLAQAAEWNAAEVCSYWKSRAVGLGNRVQLEHQGQTFTGNLIDIDPTAAILVQLDQGARRLFSAANTTIVELL